MARPVKRRCICSIPKHTCFTPDREGDTAIVRIGYDEYEVLRLMDYLGLSQAECAERIGVSRATIARLYENVRKTVAEALVLGKRLVIEGGDVSVCPKMEPECAGVRHCCHRQSCIHEEEHT